MSDIPWVEQRIDPPIAFTVDFTEEHGRMQADGSGVVASIVEKLCEHGIHFSGFELESFNFGPYDRHVYQWGTKEIGLVHADSTTSISSHVSTRLSHTSNIIPPLGESEQPTISALKQCAYLTAGSISAKEVDPSALSMVWNRILGQEFFFPNWFGLNGVVAYVSDPTPPNVLRAASELFCFQRYWESCPRIKMDALDHASRILSLESEAVNIEHLAANVYGPGHKRARSALRLCAKDTRNETGFYRSRMVDTVARLPQQPSGIAEYLVVAR